MEVFHTPVLLQEVIEGLNIQAGKKYIDATLGGGGHGLEIVKRGGKVLGIDVDEEAIEYVKLKVQSEKLKITIGNELVLVRGNFRNIGEIARENGFKKVLGIIFDLGVSFHQFKVGERGFSFLRDGPLDMRMDQLANKATAADLVNGLYKHELVSLFEKYAQEKYAWAIARAICRTRAIKRIETTAELAHLVERIKLKRGKTPARLATRHVAGRHPATGVFQALRIAVNDELNSLEDVLPHAIDLLDRGGRIAVISFHSLEDRIVKNVFGKGRVVVPSDSEIRRNPKSRSAKLRIYEKH